VNRACEVRWTFRFPAADNVEGSQPGRFPRDRQIFPNPRIDQNSQDPGQRCNRFWTLANQTKILRSYWGGIRSKRSHERPIIEQVPLFYQATAGRRRYYSKFTLVMAKARFNSGFRPVFSRDMPGAKRLSVSILPICLSQGYLVA
jgi:hypothetical protein